MTASYKFVEAVYLHAYQRYRDRMGGVYEGGYFGLFADSLSISRGDFEARGGAGWFFRKYPTENGTHINFTVKLTYSITETIGIRYSHISNGFGAFNDLNPGLDNFSLVINL